MAQDGYSVYAVYPNLSLSMEVIRVDLNKDYTEAIERAVFILQEGGVVVFPTDTLYGVGANALDVRSVKKVFSVKDRPASKPLPVIARNMRWMEELVHIKPAQYRILEKVWPGKVTVVLPKKDIIPDSVTAGSKTVGVRIPDYPFVDALLEKFGYPITATSANLSGDESTGNIDQVIRSFSDRSIRPDLVIDVGVLPQSDPSTILDLTSDRPKILRIGAAKPDQILKLLELSNDHGV